MPSSIFVARLNRYIERLLNVKGGPAIVDINPAISLEVPFLIGVEDRFLQGWNRFALSPSVAAVAAQNSVFQIRNPLGSNVIAVIERWNTEINAIVATTSTFIYTFAFSNPADLTTVAAGNNFDSRGNAASASIASWNTTAGNLGSGGATYTTGNVPVELVTNPNQEIVLLPGSAWRVLDNTVNESMRVNIIWRERALETSESN